MMYLSEDAYSLLAFLEWLASSRGLALFSVVPSFFCVVGLPSIFPVYLFFFLLIYDTAYLSKIKK